MIKIIKNFLPQQEALELSKEIYDTPASWWSYATKVKNLEPAYVNDNLRGQQIMASTNRELVDSLRLGQFTYRFKRSTTHVNNCPCYECKFRKEYLQDKLKIRIQEEMGWQDSTLFESFVSAYGSGDFLSMHTDKDRGVAFVLNLTGNWKPEYGGLLNVRQEDGTYKAIPPEFNSLVLMSINDDGGTPHFVSEVSQYAPHSRVAISGWYNER